MVILPQYNPRNILKSVKHSPSHKKVVIAVTVEKYLLSMLIFLD